MQQLLSTLGRVFRERIGWKRLGIAASLVIVSIAIMHLFRTLKGVDTAIVLTALEEKTHGQIAMAALCVLGADEKYLGPILDQAVRPRLHAWESEWLTRVEACKSCDLASACAGIPKYYLALHGDGEFASVHLRPG